MDGRYADVLKQLVAVHPTDASPMHPAMRQPPLGFLHGFAPKWLIVRRPELQPLVLTIC